MLEVRACARATAPSRCCAASISPSAPARSWRCWAATAPASRRSTTMSAASTGRSAAPSVRRPGRSPARRRCASSRPAWSRCPRAGGSFPTCRCARTSSSAAIAAAAPRGRSNLERVLRSSRACNERLTQLAGTLSGGEQQMLAIGRGLMGEPRAADPRRALARPVAAAGRGDVHADRPAQRATASPSCWSSRTSCSRSAIAHRAYVLENGRIALSGAAAELAEHPELRKSYLGH